MAETTEQERSLVRPIITIAVGEKVDVWFGGDDHSTERRDDAVGGRYVIGPGDRLVHPPVAVPVAQQF